MINNTLVLSIALNGYQWVYRKQLNTHKTYANKYGYVYQEITKPCVSPLGVECCWLKLTLMREALKSGYKRVLFLDADTVVNNNCPALSQAVKKSKYVYMAKGHSGRLNSGVILALNNTKTIEWLNTIINAKADTVQHVNDVGWGENGHVIEHSIGADFIHELDAKWNNTASCDLNDYIRHSNAGPLRKSFRSNYFHKIIFFLSARLLSLINKNTEHHLFGNNRLITETDKILNLYPKLHAS